MNATASEEKIFITIKQQLLNSSAHGLPRMLRNENYLIKILWSIVLISSLLSGAYFIINNILDYLQYETVSTISIKNEVKLEFPAVSFCSTHNFSAALNEIILTLRFNNKYETEFEKFFEQFDHSLYGNNCFRFNSDKNMLGENFLPLLSSSEPGLLYGFKLEMNLIIPDYIDYAELLIYIHKRNSLSFELNDAEYALTTGSFNYFEIEKILHENLPQPYNDCLKDVNEFKLNKTIIDYIHKKNKSYSQKDCFRLCSFLYALSDSDCKCNSTLDEFRHNCEIKWYDTELDNTTKICIQDYLSDFRNDNKYMKCHDYCPLECDRLHYITHPHLEVIPITKGIFSNKTNTDPGVKKFKTYGEFKKNYLSIYAYYKDLTYTLIKQEPKTQLFSCISSIGGILSLFLGISFLSFFEIFEIILEVFIIFISRKKLYIN